MLDRLEQARREQAMLILQAQEEERRRLALELHDESSQNLSALLIYTEILSQSLQAIPDQCYSTYISATSKGPSATESPHTEDLRQSTYPCSAVATKCTG